jgi:hypothetical protein
VDPVAVAADLPRRYDALWTELTREELFHPDEQRYRVAQRINRLNELGFDVDELELITTEAGTGCACTPRSPRAAGTGTSCSPGPGCGRPRTRPAGCSTT